jgi:hypothetical protein
MSTHFIQDPDGRVRSVITVADIYHFEGFTFEFHRFCGPQKVNKDLEPSKRQGLKFYATISRWLKLTKRQQEKTRIHG